MITIIVLLWLAASAYAVVSIVRPLRPFLARWHAVVALGAVQIALIVAAVPFLPPQEQPSAPAVAKAAAPPEKRPDVTLVRIDPNAPDAPITPLAKEDASRARSEMQAQLRLIDAAEGLLISGLSAGNRQVVELVRRDMQQLDVKLIQRRPPLGDDPWPRKAEEAHLACETAAHRLSMIAANALEGTTLEGFAARQQFGRDYLSAHDRCRAWVSKG